MGSNKSEEARGRADASKGKYNFDPPKRASFLSSNEKHERQAEKRQAYRKGYNKERNSK